VLNHLTRSRGRPPGGRKADVCAAPLPESGSSGHSRSYNDTRGPVWGRGQRTARKRRAGLSSFSYASEDAEAAERICDSLRAAGIETWFDKSEPTLHHGEDLDVPTFIRRGVPLN